MDTIHIAIPAVGEAYEFYAKVTAESIRRRSSLPVEVHYIGEDDFKRVADVSHMTSYHGSSITWSRLWLPELFPELDWVLSCDADMMFRGDVAELWRMKDVVDKDKVWVLPSRDCPLPGIPYNKASVGWLNAKGVEVKNPKEYFCAGLSLFNLKAMRCGGWGVMRDEFLKEYLSLEEQKRSLVDADQCVLNYLLQDKKQLLPRGWGVFSGDENADIDWSKPCAVHFVEDTPWKRYKITHLESDLVVEWKKLANEMGGHYRWHNWRRLAFVFLKHNQWILKLNYRLWIHLRSTRGIR